MCGSWAPSCGQADWGWIRYGRLRSEGLTRTDRDRDVCVEGRTCEHVAPLGLTPVGAQESRAQTLGGRQSQAAL